jgi:glycosyltransferase involved in cell wall biosynthesis
MVASEAIHESDAAVRVVAAGTLGDEVPGWMERLPAESDAALADFYRELAVFVLPSRFEGLGLPALEAMACGAAVVVTDNGGSRQYARNGENCLVVPVGDSDAMADAVLRLLRDDALRARIASAGTATALTYTWDRSTDELEHLLAEITV